MHRVGADKQESGETTTTNIVMMMRMMQYFREDEVMIVFLLAFLLDYFSSPWACETFPRFFII